MRSLLAKDGLKLLSWALIAILGLFGCFFIVKTVDASGGNAVAGKGHYEDHCAGCHGVTGLGDGELAADLPEAPPNIANKIDRFFELDSLLISNVIMMGKPDAGMPAYADILTKQDAKDILAYVRSVSE